MQAIIKFFQQWYINVPVVTFIATCVLITGSNMLSLHAFGVNSIGGVLALAYVVSVAALVLFVPIGTPIIGMLKLSRPGIVLYTLFGIATGSLAIWLIGMFAPRLILIDGLLAAVPFATANTMIMWLICYLTGALKTKPNILPSRKSA
jgi:hypothetical protein